MLADGGESLIRRTVRKARELISGVTSVQQSPQQEQLEQDRRASDPGTSSFKSPNVAGSRQGTPRKLSFHGRQEQPREQPEAREEQREEVQDSDTDDDDVSSMSSSVPTWRAGEGVYEAHELVKQIKSYGTDMRAKGKNVTDGMVLAHTQQRLEGSPMWSAFEAARLERCFLAPGKTDVDADFSLPAFAKWVLKERKPTERERTMHTRAAQGRAEPSGPWGQVQPDEGVDSFAHRLQVHEQLVKPHDVLFHTKTVFVQGLLSELRSQVVTKHVDDLPGWDLEKARAAAKKLEEINREYPGTRPGGNQGGPVAESTVQQRPSQAARVPPSEPKAPMDVEALMQMAARLGLSVAPMQARDVTSRQGAARGVPPAQWCDFHRASSHSTEECHLNPRNQQQRQASRPPGPGRGSQAGPSSRHASAGVVQAVVMPSGSERGATRDEQGYGQAPPPCRECGDPGHGARFCPRVICYKCGDHGHRSHDCASAGRHQGHTNRGASTMMAVNAEQHEDRRAAQASHGQQDRSAHKMPHITAHNGQEPHDSRAGYEHHYSQRAPTTMVMAVGDECSAGGGKPVSVEELTAYLRSVQVPGTDQEYVMALTRGEKAVPRGAQRTTTAVPHSFNQKAGGASGLTGKGDAQQKLSGITESSWAEAKEYAARARATAAVDKGPAKEREPALPFARDYAVKHDAEQDLSMDIMATLMKEMAPAAVMRVTTKIGMLVGAHVERVLSGRLGGQGRTVALSVTPTEVGHREAAQSCQSGGGVKAASSTTEPAGPCPAPNGVPFKGEPPARWFDHSGTVQEFQGVRPGLAFLANDSPSTGVCVTHPRGSGVTPLGQRVIVDGGSNLMVATYEEAMAGGWPVVEDEGFFFPVGPMSSVRHRVEGGVDVTYAAGTDCERTVKGVTCFLMPAISNTGAGILLASTATMPVGAMVDPVMQSLRYRPFYGVAGGADATLCNLPVRFECSVQRPTVCVLSQ